MKKQLVRVFVVLVIVIMATSGITLAKGKKVDINSATLEELQTLPGIGPKIAQAIIDGRPYKKVDDLLKIKAMNKTKLEKLREQIEIRTTTTININHATLEELQTLPGIGPKIAQAIIDGRPYKKVDDLLNVKGLGEKKCAQIRDLITVKTNINSATLDELKTLPGINAQVAQAIIDGRPYKKVDDLLKVKGIGEKTLAKIRNLIEAKSAK